MIEFLGIIYAVGKDIVANTGWYDSEKQVNSNWVEKSGFVKTLTENGFQCRWVANRNIASRELDGYMLVQEMDHDSKTYYSLFRGPEHDKIYLMAKAKRDD